MICRAWSRRRDDRGSAAIEAAILALPLLSLLAFAIVGMRVQVAGGAVEAAAHDASRAASISRTAGQAQANAYGAALDTLGAQDLHCASLDVRLNTAGFAVPVGQPATVSATITCVVDFSDLVADGMPGSRTLSATFVSPLDTFRART